MPLMKPPHYHGVMYNGTRLANGASIEVKPLDVEALEAEGWKLAGHSTAPKGAALEPKPKKKKAKAESEE